MSNYVRGVKRNQIIQRWLQGIEDPEYDVFPTKKEGKYIVKLRENQSTKESLHGCPIRTDSRLELKKSTSGIPRVEKSDDNTSDDNTPDDAEQSLDLRQQAGYVLQTESPRSRQPTTTSRANGSISKRNFVPQTISNSEVQGINLEILEQLRSLGEEIRNDRFKKENKQFIKQIVNKELNKSRIHSRYVPELFPGSTPPTPQAAPCTIPEQSLDLRPQEESTTKINQEVIPQFRSRIRR